MSKFHFPVTILVAVSFIIGVSVFGSTADAARLKNSKKKKKAKVASILASVKRDPVAASGRCLRQLASVQEANDVLARNGVSVERSINKRQLLSLAMGVLQVENLASSSGHYIDGVKVTFPKRDGVSRYRVGTKTIEMGANHTDGNVAHLMHEMGHHVGHSGLYDRYKRNVQRCHFTQYSRTNSNVRNEEFAEVFAAFVTRPELISQSKLDACRKAFEFLTGVFRNRSAARCANQ